MNTAHFLLLILLHLLQLTTLSSKEIDLSANLHKNLRVRTNHSKLPGPKPVEKANSPYFVRILRRKPNFIIDDSNDAEVEGIPRILKSAKRFPILARNLENGNDKESESEERRNNGTNLKIGGGKEFSEVETMEEASSTLSGSTTTFLPLLGQILSSAAEESSVAFKNASSAPSTQVEEQVQLTADREQTTLFPVSTENEATTFATTSSTTTSTTPIPTTRVSTTTVSSTTTKVSTTTTTRATTETPSFSSTTPKNTNIRLVQTNQIEIVTFPSTRKPNSVTVTTTTTTGRPWTFFQPKRTEEVEKNPLDVILAAPGNFLVGMFKGIQQATEFVGDTISGFANLLLPPNRNANKIN